MGSGALASGCARAGGSAPVDCSLHIQNNHASKSNLTMGSGLRPEQKDWRESRQCQCNGVVVRKPHLWAGPEQGGMPSFDAMASQHSALTCIRTR